MVPARSLENSAGMTVKLREVARSEKLRARSATTREMAPDPATSARLSAPWRAA